ncbi:DNA cytosine methyltransferase [Croceifilum oryzae]|nr:DNA (cytosine-5-)-methyltransferase [Croceifilum oryzae]
MRVLDLFSGIGGIALAAHWAEMETAAFCEIEPFCQKVLAKNFPDIPIYDDVRTITKEQLEMDGVIDDYRTIDLVAGGFPCQPFSLAGKREGENDSRHLWPEMFRVIREIQPRWVLGENVSGHITNGLDAVISDLESEGYTAWTFLLPAAIFGAPHERKRIFIVGHSNSQSKSQTNPAFNPIRSERKSWENTTGKSGGKVSRRYWQENKPPIRGMDDGLFSRLDKSRLISLGNAVVPQQIYPILKAIKEEAKC